MNRWFGLAIVLAVALAFSGWVATRKPATRSMVSDPLGFITFRSIRIGNDCFLVTKTTDAIAVTPLSSCPDNARVINP